MPAAPARALSNGLTTLCTPLAIAGDARPAVRHVRLEWALAHREAIRATKWDIFGGIGSYAVRTLGQVGTAHTADLSRHHYVHDTELGRDAVASVHAIDARTRG